MLQMERWAGRTALVTGASSGIGAAVARALTNHGMTVIGCSRRPEVIQELSGGLGTTKGKLLVEKCDMRKEEDISALFQKIKADHGGVDVCVNNAGIAHNAPILSGSVDDWREMLETNVLGLTMCTKEAVKSMRERGVDDGHVINLNSMSGHRMLRSSAGHFYSATKYAVTALTEGTRNELREMKSHIRVTQISPGVVETNFHEHFLGKAAAVKTFKSFKVLEPENMADLVVYALSAPPHVQIHDIQVRATEQVT